ncbi:MAG TPA: hypothetical protein VFW86_03255 [Candidatus Limnocylindrales bacterium]|jgi:hypothetical protein|nr:hypothetical protein [Candidatus Limnocylindrales bacterium]
MSEAPSGRLVRGRLRGMDLAAAARVGGQIGLALGLPLGAIAGSLLAWTAGAILDWERQFTITYGVAANLLPFAGDGGGLASISQAWYAVVPIATLLGGALAAGFGALAGCLVAASWNRSRRHGVVLVEVLETQLSVDLRPADERPESAPTGPAG